MIAAFSCDKLESLAALDATATAKTVCCVAAKRLPIENDEDAIIDDENRTTSRPFLIDVFLVGRIELLLCVQFRPLPLLSCQRATLPSAETCDPPEVASKSVEESEASHQPEIPAIIDGEIG
jgi:hypothetical protein